MPNDTAASPAWGLIEERLRERDGSLKWFARQLADTDDPGEVEKQRRTIYKWRDGDGPGPDSAQRIAAVLGGDPGDYVNEKRLVTKQELRDEIQRLRTRIAELEGRPQAPPPASSGQ